MRGPVSFARGPGPMNFRVARYIHAELDGGWRGWVLAEVEGLRGNSQITNVQLDGDAWSTALKSAAIGSKSSRVALISKSDEQRAVDDTLLVDG